MFIQTQNVQALPRMTPEKVVHDVNLTASQSDLIGWQEIILDYYRLAIRELDPQVWDSLMIKDLGNIGGCPISWKKHLFELEDSGKIKLFTGLPGIGKTRYIVWALLRDKRNGALVMVINTHYVAKGYSKKRVTARKLRQRLWLRSNEKLNDFVMECALKGYLIAILGDFNRMFFPPVGRVVFGHEVHNVNPPSSIDKVVLIDNDEFEWHNPQLTSKGGMKYSDHKGHNVGTIIKRKAR